MQGSIQFPCLAIILNRVLTFNTFEIQCNFVHDIWLLSISEYRSIASLQDVRVAWRILILNTLLYSFYLPFVVIICVIQVTVICYLFLNLVLLLHSIIFFFSIQYSTFEWSYHEEKILNSYYF